MKKIALVEDNPDNRMLVQALLDGEYDITEYEDGTQALAGMRREQPDLVLLDISLPGLDGLQVLQAMKGDVTLNDLPVIALTAHAMSGDRERFLDAGFDGYVTKPITDEELLHAAIRRHVAA
ncbi:MAG TPA: response regulator [Longimicrobium sp.]|jgi:two-component system cell cycle response regulator DivK